MDRRSLILASLLSATILAPLGCSVETAAEEDENVAETHEELTVAAKSLVGKYYTHQAVFGGFARLTLEKNGKYTASLDDGGTAFCIQSPCLIPESGTFNASKIGGKIRLRIRPTGGVSRWYDAKKTSVGLELTRAGAVEKLVALEDDGCLDDADCKATEQCGPKLCFMACLVGDPFCCGPSTCEPKPPPPPPPSSCWGAWLDQNGLCRTPADGVYPASCCAGPACGPTHCAAGEVCCNPLSGICTPPGGVCAQ
jgi:hypothetical protein